MAKRFETLAALACFKTLLMIFNILFWFSGLLLICIGIWSKVSLYVYTQLSVNNYAFTPYLLIAIGALILSASILGCCCTAKATAKFLYLYAGILLLIFLLEFIAGISFYAKRHKIIDGFKLGLNYSIHHYPYQDERSVDYLQKALKCCGVDGYIDWFETQYGSFNDSVPLSCCSTVPLSHCVHSGLSPNSSLVENSIFTQGCYDKVTKFVNSNMATIGGSAFSIAFFNVLGLLLSVFLARSASKAQYENIEN